MRGFSKRCQARAITKQFRPCKDRSLKGAIMASDKQRQLPVVSCLGTDTETERTELQACFQQGNWLVVEMLYQIFPDKMEKNR